MKGCWIFFKDLYVFIELVMWFSYIILFMCCIRFITLHILKYSCIFGKILTWLQCIIFLMCCWIWFASILLRIFVFMLIKKEIYSFLGFFCVSLSGFGIRVILTS
jgi:hypothetical protein